MIHEIDGMPCVLKIAHELERTGDHDPAIKKIVPYAQRCSANRQCPDRAYCVIACAGLLGRLGR